MEGVLLVSSTGSAPGSIYGSTFALRTTEFWLPTSDFDRNSRDKRSKDRLRTGWRLEAFRLLCDERDVAHRCVDEPNRRAATGPVLCRLHHAP